MLWAQSSTHKTCYTFFLDKVKKQHNRKLCNGKPHKTSDYSKSNCRFMLFLGCLGKHVNRGITVLFFIIRIWIMGYWRYQTLQNNSTKNERTNRKKELIILPHPKYLLGHSERECKLCSGHSLLLRGLKEISKIVTTLPQSHCRRQSSQWSWNIVNFI